MLKPQKPLQLTGQLMGQCSAGWDRQWGGGRPQEGEVYTDGPFRDSLLEELGLEVLEG